MLSSITTTLNSSRIVHRLVFVRVVAAAWLLSGCVASTSYEQATSAAEVEQEAHRRTAQKLDAAETEMARLEAERLDLRQKVSETEGQVSEGEMGIVTAEKERDQQTQLVTQLRGELARVGEHIKTYADDQAEISKKLSVAEEREQALEAQIEAQKAQIAALKSEIQSKTIVGEKLDNAMEELAKLQASAEEKPEPSKPVDEPSQVEEPDEADSSDADDEG